MSEPFSNLYVQTFDDLASAVERFGFVPLFMNSIPGFSVEEHVAKEAWFSAEEGVWEWKGPVIRTAGCAYGKFFERKACFVSREWFLDLANYRRDGYDFDARFDDELASYRDKELYDVLESRVPILSTDLKEVGGYRKGGKGGTAGGKKGFDTIMNRLQEQGYALISDFVYLKDKNGNRYGWGVAEYSTPEAFFGPEFRASVYRRTPEESYARLVAHFKELLPDAGEEAIKKFLK